MDKIEKIRQEIERLYDGEAPRHNQQCDFSDGYFTGIGVISALLDTLSEEPDKGLEEAAEEYGKAQYGRKASFLPDRCRGCYAPIVYAFKAGAEWQASQMPMPEDTVLFNKGVAEGRRLEREDMLRDAMECEVDWYDGYYLNFSEEQIMDAVDKIGAGLGDKIRIVVLKGEEE